MYRFSVRAVALGAAVAVGLLLSESAAFAQCAPSNGANSARASTWVAGGQVGYNWQQGAMVYGLETDLSGTNLQSAMNGGLTSIASCPGDAASTTAKVDWYGSLRGRVGWTADKVLFYGTAGLAYGHVNLSSNYNSLLLSLSSNNSSTRAGWVVGAGIDYMLRPELFLNLGYQYVDLGTVSLAASTSSSCCTIAQTANAHAAFHVVAVRLSWRFMPGSMPWDGAYIGGHVGGAWGLNTDATYTGSILAAPSDIRLKREIALIGRLENGLGLYRYRYLWSDTVYVGVMAQEVALIRPDTIVRDALDPYLRVDYGRLGLRLMTLPAWKARANGATL